MRDGKRLEEPDVCNWGGQFDVAHTLTAHFLKRNFNTTFLADNAAILHALIFTAEAFVIFDRPKDTRAEQAVALWLEGTVVDGFWLFDFAKRPRQDALRGRERDLDLVERLDGATGLNGLFVSSWFIFKSLKGEHWKRSGPIFQKNRGLEFSRKFYSSSSASRSSIFRPRPRTSLTRTLKLSGTPAS